MICTSEKIEFNMTIYPLETAKSHKTKKNINIKYFSNILRFWNVITFNVGNYIINSNNIDMI